MTSPVPTQGLLLETHNPPTWRPTSQLFGMQNGQTGTDSGTWIDARSIKDGSFEFLNDGPSGSISAFSAEIHVSNALKVPANSADGTLLGSAVSALGMVNLSSTARWIKVKVASITVTGAGSLGVRLHAHNY